MLRRILTSLGLPPGAGILFSSRTRVRLFLSLLGSILTALLDMLGVAALVPLMELATGQPLDEGALGLISRAIGGEPDRSTLAVVVAIGMVTAFTLKGLLAVTFRWWLLGFINGQQRETAVRLLRGFLAAPYAMHLRRGLPDLMRSLQDGVGVTYAKTVTGSVSMAAEAVTIVGLITILVIANPLVALATVGYFGISMWLLNRSLRRHTIEAGSRALVASIDVFKTATTAIGGAKEIRLRHNGEAFAQKYDAARQLSARTNRLQLFLGELPRYLLETIFVLGMATMALVVFTTDQGASALTTLAVFLAAGTRMLPSMVRFMASLSAARVGLPSMRLVVQELHDHPAPPRLPGPPSVPGPRGDVSMTGVSFRYAGSDVDVLKDVSITIPQGGSLAVVGPSGSGKTTLVDVLMGLHQLDRGRVEVAGHDIRDNLAGWQTSIGLVPQDSFWMDDTVIANVAFGVAPGDVDQERLVASIRRAHLDDVVAALPEGLHTVIGENGTRLSGGQRQRLGIARALYVDPQLIVLDEATSALDNLTERRIAETLEDLHGHTTIVIVAHRLSTVRRCDQLVFLRDGVIETRGTFEEVRSSNAAFAHLVELGSLNALEPQALGEVSAHERRST